MLPSPWLNPEPKRQDLVLSVHYESVKRSSGRREPAKPSQIQVVRVIKSLATLPGAIANLLRLWFSVEPGTAPLEPQLT